ncbi:MAG: hypothetical protein ACLT3C_02285 [Peptococcus niger]
MKKIIGGKRYNTETAKYIGSGFANCGVTDFKYFEESLYLKKTGEFFLHGEGGPASKYAKEFDGSMWGDEKIIPISLEEARAWGEKYLSPDEYEKVFEVEEEDSVLFSVLLPETLYAELKEEAEEKGVSMKEIVVDRLK